MKRDERDVHGHDNLVRPRNAPVRRPARGCPGRRLRQQREPAEFAAHGPRRLGDARATHRDFSVNVGDIVYFTTDSTDLTPEATTILQKQSQWLQQYPQYTITIEGHADERGTREYNIALGARRATTVRNFLAQNGINGSRIRTISYGKERPVAVCNDISCWSQNRRAQTVLNSRTAGN